MDEPDVRYRSTSLAGVVAWGAWALATSLFIAFALVWRVPTYLGVEAPAWDKSGTEYVWRVWWRARDSMVQVEPGWLFTLFYLGAATLVVVAGSFAMWLILVRGAAEDDVAKTA